MPFAGRDSGASAADFVPLARVADALGEGASALAANVDEARIAGDLVERGQGALRFGQQFVVQVRFELQERVVDAEAVVLHAALKQSYEFLLASKPLEDLHQLIRSGIQRVVEFCLAGFRSLFPAKGFFAEIGDAPVDVQIWSLEIL
jgi:hypothetical protein